MDQKTANALLILTMVAIANEATLADIAMSVCLDFLVSLIVNVSTSDVKYWNKNP